MRKYFGKQSLREIKILNKRVVLELNFKLDREIKNN